MSRESESKFVIGEIFSGVALLVGEGGLCCRTLHESRTEKKKKKFDAGLGSNER
jgi:hypothetical protein